MQARIGRAMAERTRLLAAVSHDLRTPITTLRLRAEMVDDPELQERMLATLDEMQALTEAGLLLARGTSAEEPTVAVDLGALVESLAADQADLGAAVTVEPQESGRIVLRCRPLALKRALRNLVENAVRYGGGARLALAGDGRRITLRSTTTALACPATCWSGSSTRSSGARPAAAPRPAAPASASPSPAPSCAPMAVTSPSPTATAAGSGPP